VAVRAQDTDVFDPIVGKVAIDVMELERNGFAVPLREPALLAPAILVSGGDQASFELAVLVAAATA
jgi:hypothetical protein